LRDVPTMLLLTVAAALATAPQPVFTGCSHVPQVRPASVVIACADANLYVSGLRWSRWGSSDAVATGTAHENDCTPYCAAGHFHTYPATLRLSFPVSCVTGRREFSTLRWRFAGRGSSETLSCIFLKLRP
jgi:hypothetical protein